jgi:hypothetical protein
MPPAPAAVAVGLLSQRGAGTLHARAQQNQQVWAVAPDLVVARRAAVRRQRVVEAEDVVRRSRW